MLAAARDVVIAPRTRGGIAYASTPFINVEMRVFLLSSSSRTQICGEQISFVACTVLRYTARTAYGSICVPTSVHRVLFGWDLTGSASPAQLTLQSFLYISTTLRASLCTLSWRIGESARGWWRLPIADRSLAGSMSSPSSWQVQSLCLLILSHSLGDGCMAFRHSQSLGVLYSG